MFLNINDTPPNVGDIILAMRPGYPRTGGGSNLRWKLMIWEGSNFAEKPIEIYKTLHDLEVDAISDLYASGRDPIVVVR